MQISNSHRPEILFSAFPASHFVTLTCLLTAALFSNGRNAACIIGIVFAQRVTENRLQFMGESKR
jgi:hypothetical protein